MLDRKMAERVNARLLTAENMAHELLEAEGSKLTAHASSFDHKGIMSGEEARQLLGDRRAG